MADDPTRYLDVSGVLALKPGATVDVDYTVVHAQSVAARHRELGASIDALADATEATLDELGRQWTTSHIDLDVDGVPYYSPGSRVIPVRMDTDGTPYLMIGA